MSEAHANQEQQQSGALFGWSSDFLVDRFSQLLGEQQDWAHGITVDTALIQRAMTCVDFCPTMSGIFVDSLSRPVLFHQLIGDVYMAVSKAGLIHANVKVAEIHELLKTAEFSPDLALYLEIEKALTGLRALAGIVARAMRKLAQGLEFFQVITGRTLSPSFPSGTHGWSIHSVELGVLRGVTQEAGSFVVPGDALVFTQNTTKIQLGSKQDPIRFVRHLLEADVLCAVARHFMDTGVPPESIIVVDISTGESQQRILNPASFVRSIDLASLAFVNVIKGIQGEQVQRRDGGWCRSCDLRFECETTLDQNSHQISRDDEEEL